MYDTPRWLKVTAIMLSVLLFAGMLCFIYLEEQEAAELEAHMEMLNQKTYQYRQEKIELEQELEEIEKGVVYVSDKAMLMIGFILSDDSDLTYITQKAEQYQFTPVLLIDCSTDNTDSLQFVTASDRVWDVIFYAPSYTEELKPQIMSTRNNLKGLPVSDTGLLFISGEPSKEKLQTIVTECDLVGYAEYSESPSSGQNEDGSIYFDYLHLKRNHYSQEYIPAIEERLNACVKKRAAMLFAFDMNHINSSIGVKKFADAILETIRVQDTKYQIFSSASEVSDELKTFNQRNAELERTNAKRREEIKKEIEELERLIGEIMQS